MLKFGLSEMDKESKKAIDVNDADLENLLGKSEKGHWIEPADTEVSNIRTLERVLLESIIPFFREKNGLTTWK